MDAQKQPGKDVKKLTNEIRQPTRDLEKQMDCYITV